ncbi:MAG: spore gernimation protein GerC [Paenibacillaceae bacterium]|jgi:spore germination protein|nr:spore gernimation protein GerC [Paenibacillaceae bacterium]
MYKQGKLILMHILLAALVSGCWSSREIEDLALYAGLALDSGQPAPTEKNFEAKGATYSKQNKVMVTIQVVPAKSVGDKEEKKQHEAKMPYFNISGSGDSILEIFRQFSIRRDRPIIGHHLKVIVISADLLKKQSIRQLTDFVLRDNDIRPSTMVYISEGPARETLVSGNPGEVPAFHILGMLRNRSRTGKVLQAVTLSRLDGLMHARKSFALQNLVTGGGETELSGAGVIKGSTGQWIGTLSQEDAQCLSWLEKEGGKGVIKTWDEDNEPLTFEIKSMKSKLVSHVEGEKISFQVSLATKGHLIEVWNKQTVPAADNYVKKTEQLIEEKLDKMMRTLIRKLQSDYKADVAGFGNRLAIEHPAVWKTVKDNWDEVFSGTEIEFRYDVNITDFGSFTEEEG